MFLINVVCISVVCRPSCQNKFLVLCKPSHFRGIKTNSDSELRISSFPVFVIPGYVFLHLPLCMDKNSSPAVYPTQAIHMARLKCSELKVHTF